MKAQELRIGNLVFIGGVAKKIDGLEIYYDEIVDPINPQPIPLTEEWLMKFGFEEKNTLYRYGIDGTSDLMIALNGDCLIREFTVGAILPLSIEVKYVHQLQNLYYALTGEELTIKELTT